MDKGSNSSFNTIVRALALLLLVAVCVFPVAHAADPDALSADGGRYYGPIVDGKRHGQGRIEWDTGARYEGGFVRGLYAGKGRLQLASGDVYEGEFVAGMMSGRGSLTLANGERYVGEFRNDVFQGQGRYTFPDGDSYEGAFERGRFHGQGTMTRAASVYRGEFRNGEFWGKGELAYDGGRKYTGEFVRGRFQGTGRYEDGTGDAYEGQFEQDEFTGIGAYLRSDGSRHEGGFRKWKPQGATIGNCRDGPTLKAVQRPRVNVIVELPRVVLLPRADLAPLTRRGRWHEWPQGSSPERGHARSHEGTPASQPLFGRGSPLGLVSGRGIRQPGDQRDAAAGSCVVRGSEWIDCG